MKARLYLPRVLPAVPGPSAPPPAAPSRVRANSAARSLYTSSALPLSFFDSPPAPAPSRTPHRLPLDAKGPPAPGAPDAPAPPPAPAPLALAAPPPQALAPAAAQYALFPYPPVRAAPHPPAPAPRAPRRPRLRFTLDVAAYGIPKRPPRFARPPAPDDAPLAVQVGEDAYFVRPDAMGVADGVGGWARRHPDAPPAPPPGPSPSALFARRLMHYCSAEIAAATATAAPPPPPRHVQYPWPPPAPAPAPALPADADAADPLAELADGLDVLSILERAYAKTLANHVAPPARPRAPPTPLHTGSSTALLAVLDHAPPPAAAPPGPGPAPAPRGDAVLRIAHLGDCMGMLVRGDAIAWRSDEMWWGFNTPVQLGPASGARARDAQVLALPVQRGDVLILASDGLSDNLWDEDVLDEVVRLRAALGAGAGVLRRTLAGLLSEALCSRARRAAGAAGEGPFARRAREAGRAFRGGKSDDISVVVAVVAPVEPERAEGA